MTLHCEDAADFLDDAGATGFDAIGVHDSTDIVRRENIEIY